MKQLRAAYRATRYHIISLNVKLRPGRRCPALDRWLRQHDVRRWALLTAWNPRSRLLSRKWNRARQQALLAAVSGFGYRMLPARNMPLGTARLWIEESLFVPELPLPRARQLGRRFGQAALLAGRREQPARLVFL